MALTYIPLANVFGPSAVKSADATPNTTLTLKIGELGEVTNGVSNISNTATISTEGILLGLLQKAFDNQVTGTSSALSITRNSPLVSSRGGENVQGERYVITIYSSAPVLPIDPSHV